MRIRRRLLRLREIEGRERYMQVIRKTAPVRDTVFQCAMHSCRVRTIGCLSRLHLNEKLIGGNCSFDRDVVDKYSVEKFISR